MAASTQDQIDAINNAIAAGVSRVVMPDGSSVEYPGLSALVQAKLALQAQLAQEQSGGAYMGVSFGRPC